MCLWTKTKKQVFKIRSARCVVGNNLYILQARHDLTAQNEMNTVVV